MIQTSTRKNKIKLSNILMAIFWEEFGELDVYTHTAVKTVSNDAAFRIMQILKAHQIKIETVT